MEQLIRFIRNYIPVSNELTADIEKEVVLKKINKGENLLSIHSIAKFLYFIDEGIARTYYYHNDKEITSWFYPKGNLVTAWSSFFNNTPSFETLEAITDMDLICFSRNSLEMLYNKHHHFERFGRLMMQDQMSKLESFFMGFYFLSAKEKYELLISYYPDITQQVNLGHIASFLGIAQETLSRIRNK